MTTERTEATVTYLSEPFASGVEFMRHCDGRWEQAAAIVAGLLARIEGLTKARDADRIERAKPIDEGWLKSMGWLTWSDCEDEAYSGTLYLSYWTWLGWEFRLVWTMGHVEAVRMNEDGDLVAESVSLLGEPCTMSKDPTRGQLLDLLAALKGGTQ